MFPRLRRSPLHPLRSLALGLGLVGLATASTPAFAQPPAATSSYATCARTPSKEEAEQAHSRYTAGKLHYDEGDYDNAIKRFKEAYALDCTKHDLLVIISATYEKKNDRLEAIKALETYVQRVGNTPETPTYNAKIENLKREHAKQQAAQQPPTNPPTKPSDRVEPARSEGGHTIFPWLLVGAGGAAVVAGVVVLVTTPSLPVGCNADTERCTPLPGESPDSSDFQDRQSRAGAHVQQPIYGAIVIGGGVVLAGAGLLWHFLEPTDASTGKTGRSGKTRLLPNVGAGFGGMSLQGTF